MMLHGLQCHILPWTRGGANVTFPGSRGLSYLCVSLRLEKLMTDCPQAERPISRRGAEPAETTQNQFSLSESPKAEALTSPLLGNFKYLRLVFAPRRWPEGQRQGESPAPHRVARNLSVALMPVRSTRSAARKPVCSPTRSAKARRRPWLAPATREICPTPRDGRIPWA